MKGTMDLPEVHILKHRIAQLVQSHQVNAGPQAIESFLNRFRKLNHRIHQLPFADRNVVQSVLYARLEQVLMRFEELEWLGPQSGPVRDTYQATEAIDAFILRSQRMDDRIERLPTVEKLATSAVLHRHLEAVLMPFEECRFLRRRRVKRHFAPQSRSRWN